MKPQRAPRNTLWSQNKYPNPAKPEPKLTAKTKKESKKIEFGTRFDWLIADRNSQREKQYFPDFMSSRFLIFLSIFARNLVLRDYNLELTKSDFFAFVSSGVSKFPIAIFLFSCGLLVT
jgi:hypothetical protein